MDHEDYPDDNKQWCDDEDCRCKITGQRCQGKTSNVLHSGYSAYSERMAKEYILDPLHGPEPSQDCGPGSSFITATGVARKISVKHKDSQGAKGNKPTRTKSSNSNSNKESAARSKPLPNLPTGSPSRSHHQSRRRPSNPISPSSFGPAQKTINEEVQSEDLPLLRKLVDRTKSFKETLAGNTNSGRYPPPAGLRRSKTVHSTRPVQTEWNQGTIVARSNSVSTTGAGDSVTEWATPAAKPARGTRRPSIGLSHSKSVIAATPRPRENLHRGTTVTRSASVRTTGRPDTPIRAYSFATSPVTSPLAFPESPKRYQLDDRPMAASPVMSNNPFKAQMEEDKGKRPQRSGSLSARFPGDMSHRPLAMLKQQHRAADRNPFHYSSGHRHVKQPSDPIDVLDKTGVVSVPYHHDGPYDPTLADRNTNNLYPPIEAVRDSNMEAIKATPRENIQDSLDKHVPLQGTAIIPPGMPDMSGRRMEYKEGADLMRERDAAGGAYKRYDFISYDDNDLKGKGEPSYTYEKEKHDRKRSDGTVMYEMQSNVNSGSPRNKDHGAHVRQRSISNADKPLPTSPTSRAERVTGNEASDSGVSRRNTTGKSKFEGLKRRIGSLRRKKTDDDDYV